ncbi:hypothetical protein R3P38DRAFT_2765918 [Favolaschia claudopus]|uniref:Uncharacterized protein n=1 Tax=Favolaschia claudopus TaxID=2862362 RepID=A0AAW0D8U0_9AGAR
MGGKLGWVGTAQAAFLRNQDLDADLCERKIQRLSAWRRQRRVVTRLWGFNFAGPGTFENDIPVVDYVLPHENLQEIEQRRSISLRKAQSVTVARAKSGRLPLRHDNFSSIGARERLLMAPSAYSVGPTPIPSSSAYCAATDGNLRHLHSAARPLGAHRRLGGSVL